MPKINLPKSHPIHSTYYHANLCQSWLLVQYGRL